MPHFETAPPKKPRSVGQLGLQLFIAAIGVLVVTVIGSIVVNAVKNHGLLPAPSALDRYDCTAGSLSFSFYYLHGTQRVAIQSKIGSMQGTVSQNWLDWHKFNQERTLLGFVPPAEIAFEDARALRLNGPGFPEARCVNTVDTAGRRRGLIP